MYNRREDIQDISAKDRMYLTMNVWFHFTQFLLTSFIIFLLPATFDPFVILLLMIVLPIKYFLYNRKCILTEQEKQIMANRFYPRHPGAEPYLQYLNADKLVAFVKIFFFYPLLVFTFFTIIYRYFKNHYLAICVATIIIWFNAYTHINFTKHYVRILLS